MQQNNQGSQPVGSPGQQATGAVQGGFSVISQASYPQTSQVYVQNAAQPSQQQNQHILSRSSLKPQGNNTQGTPGPQGSNQSNGFSGTNNRISKQNLRDNSNNLKDYGMSIITGGTTKGSSQQSAMKDPTANLMNKSHGSSKAENPLAHQNSLQYQQFNSSLGASGPNMNDLIEVKTTANSYKLGKNTINSRVGEDFEPDKPIMSNNLSQPYQQKTQSQQDNPLTPSLGHKDSRIEGRNQYSQQKQQEQPEEVKIQHYNRKLMETTGQHSVSGGTSSPKRLTDKQQFKNQGNSVKRNSQHGGATNMTQQYRNTPNSPPDPAKMVVLDNYSAALQQQNFEMMNNPNSNVSNNSYQNPQQINKKNKRGGQVSSSKSSTYQQFPQPNYEISGPIQQENIELKHAKSPNQIDPSLKGQDSMVVRQAEQIQRVKQESNIHQNHIMNRDKQAKLRRAQIVINTNHCRGELDTVQYVVGKNGYRETTQPGDGTLLWYGMALRDHDLDIIKMRKCIFNRYPLMDHFAKKNIFCVIISRLQRFFPIDYKFMPDSFLLPDEVRDFEHHMRSYSGQTFIAKPSKGRGGDGIILIKKFTDLPKSAFHHEFLVQRYIDNPLILDKKKFDCRLYVLIRGVDPVEAYLYDEGLARFCTHNYKKPDYNNIKDLYMHLTNFSLNKNSQRFKAPGESFQNDDKSSKQLFTQILKTMMARGKDVRYLMKQIRDVAQKTVIALEPYLKNAYHCFISTNHQNPRSFQILGLDILIDENLNAWLLEVNANPSLNVYTDKELPNGDIEQTLSELDKYVKTNLLSDTIKVVTTPNDQIAGLQEMGLLKKILPMPNGQLDELYLYSYAEKMFEILAGQKSYDFITSSQFQKLSKYQGLTNSHILKAHYDIIYKNVVRRSDNNQMDLNCFFEALEELAGRLFNHQDSYDNLQEVIEVIKKHVSPASGTQSGNSQQSMSQNQNQQPRDRNGDTQQRQPIKQQI